MASGTECLKHKIFQKHLTEQIDESLYDYICVHGYEGVREQKFCPLRGSPTPYSLRTPALTNSLCLQGQGQEKQ